MGQQIREFNILNESGIVIGKGKYQVGISDVAREKSNTILKKGLSIAFDYALKDANIDVKDLKYVVSAGMDNFRTWLM